MRQKIGKIIFTIVVSVLISTQTAKAQEHLTFYNIPIEGSISSFITSLKIQGWQPCRAKYKFRNMQTKAVKGAFWHFPDCIVYARKFNFYDEVTSVYIHPQGNYRLLGDLIDAFDTKYGPHEATLSRTDINDVIYTWTTPLGMIQIFGRTIYGQSFDIIYRDKQEVSLIEQYNWMFDRDL